MKITDESLQKTLIDFGLSEKEARIYLAAINLGPTTVLKISALSGLKRPTAYLIINSLVQKGLFSIEIKGFKKLYRAESPDKLEAIFNQKKHELSKMLPFLRDLYSKDKSDSFIRYYEGVEAVKLVYEELLESIKPKDEYLVIGNQEEWFSLDSKFAQRFIEKRAKLGLDLRLLFQDSPIAREHKKFEKNYNEKIRILPKDTSLTTNMVITPNRVVIHQLSSPVLAIVIENKNISKMNKEMFEMIWNSIK